MNKSTLQSVSIVIAVLATISITVVAIMSSITNKQQLKQYTAMYKASVEVSNTNFNAYEQSQSEFKTETTKLKTANSDIATLNGNIIELNTKIEDNTNVIAKQDSVLEDNSNVIKILQKSMKVYFNGVDKLRRKNAEINKINSELNSEIIDNKQTIVGMQAKLAFAQQFIPEVTE